MHSLSPRQHCARPTRAFWEAMFWPRFFDLYIDQHRSSNPHPFLSPKALEANAVLERIAACPETGSVSNGSVRSVFLTIFVQVGSTSSRWLERRKWRKAWRSCLVPGLANLCNLSAPMTMIGLIGMSYKDSSGEFRWCECVLDLIHLLMSYILWFVEMQ